MTKMTYAQQLAHPKWQRRRLEMLDAAGWACATCGDTDQQLHVHHRAYFKGRMAWEYADHELAVLCSTCHGIEHEAKELLDELLLAMPQSTAPVKVALSLLAGYFGGDSDTVFDTTVRMDKSGLIVVDAGMAGCIAAMLSGLSTDSHVEITKFVNTLREKEGLDEF